MVTASFWPDTKVTRDRLLKHRIGLDCQEGHYDVDRHGHFWPI